MINNEIIINVILGCAIYNLILNSIAKAILQVFIKRLSETEEGKKAQKSFEERIKEKIDQKNKN